jgi:Flp pilus assembly protein TadG
MDPRRLRPRRRRGRGRGEAGVSTVEVVVLVPVLIAFIMIMVGFGIYADDVSQVQGAAQDAARIASLQRSQDAAMSYAQGTAAADMGDTCAPTVERLQEVSTAAVGGPAGQAGGQPGTVAVLQITLQCQVTVFGYAHAITETAYAPVDTYRGGTP